MHISKSLKLFLGILCFTFWTSNSWAQQTVLTKKITLPEQDYTVSHLFEVLIASYNINLSYNNELERTDTRLIFPKKEYTLQAVFNEIEKQSGTIEFIIKDNNIIAKQKKPIKRVTISGFIKGKSDGEALIGATIYDRNSSTGTVADNYGFYSIKTIADRINVEFSYLGYETYHLKCTLTRDTIIDIKLSSQIAIKEVIVNANRLDKLESTQVSSSRIDLKKASLLPQLIGESDLMKTIQLLPGVQQGTEGTGGIYVRGGSQGDNLVLLDGAPVYCLNHFFGLFSVFNTDAIRKVELYKGGFPSNYGGRLSSVLDIRTKEGNNQKFSGSGTIGLISSKLLLEGPIVKGKTSFVLSGRRSNIDLIANPFFEEGNLLRGLHFYDANLKINHQFSSRNRLFFSLYKSEDNLSMFIDNTIFPDLDGEYDSTHIQLKNISNNISWDNVSSSLRWNYVITNNLFLKTTCTYSSYGTNRASESNTFLYNMDQNQQFKEVFDLENRSVQTDFSWFPTNKHSLKFGGSYIYNTIPFTQGKSFKKEDEIVYDTVFFDTLLKTQELHFYLGDDIRLSENLKAQIGAHASLYHVDDKWYRNLEPRVSLRYSITPSWSVKAAYSEMAQYMFQKPDVFEAVLTNKSISLKLNPEVWAPCTKKLPPQKSKQIVLGTYLNLLSKFNLSLEGYYKKISNVIENSDIPQDGIGVPEVWEDLFQHGKGRSYGLEFLLEKNEGKLNGWIAYTLSKTERQFENVTNGQYFPYKFDRRHNLNFVANYRFNERIDMGLIWVYRSGNRLTIPDGKYTSNFNLNTPNPENETYDIYALSNVNAYQLPAYQRLDLSVNLHKKRKTFSRILSLGAYNVYNHHNSFLVFLDYRSANQNEIDDGTISVISFSQFSFLPYINYTINF